MVTCPCCPFPTLSFQVVTFRVHAPSTRPLLLDIFANSVSSAHYLTGQPIKFKSVCKFKVDLPSHYYERPISSYMKQWARSWLNVQQNKNEVMWKRSTTELPEVRYTYAHLFEISAVSCFHDVCTYHLKIPMRTLCPFPIKALMYFLKAGLARLMSSFDKLTCWPITSPKYIKSYMRGAFSIRLNETIFSIVSIRSN